jgi:hypothetical protein
VGNSASAPGIGIRLPVVVMAAVAITVLGIWWYLARRAAMSPAQTPPGVTAEAKAYVRNLQLSGVDMKATQNFTGADLVEITGRIANGGDRTLARVELSCVFYDTSGLVVLRERVPIVRSLLKPGEGQSFRLPFEGIPESWNQALPQLVIAHIAFAE